MSRQPRPRRGLHGGRQWRQQRLPPPTRQSLCLEGRETPSCDIDILPPLNDVAIAIAITVAIVIAVDVDVDVDVAVDVAVAIDLPVTVAVTMAAADVYFAAAFR